MSVSFAEHFAEGSFYHITSVGGRFYNAIVTYAGPDFVAVDCINHAAIDLRIPHSAIETVLRVTDEGLLRWLSAELKKLRVSVGD